MGEAVGCSNGDVKTLSTSGVAVSVVSGNGDGLAVVVDVAVGVRVNVAVWVGVGVSVAVGTAAVAVGVADCVGWARPALKVAMMEKIDGKVGVAVGVAVCCNSDGKRPMPESDAAPTGCSGSQDVLNKATKTELSMNSVNFRGCLAIIVKQFQPDYGLYNSPREYL